MGVDDRKFKCPGYVRTAGLLSPVKVNIVFQPRLESIRVHSMPGVVEIEICRAAER